MYFSKENNKTRIVHWMNAVFLHCKKWKLWYSHIFIFDPEAKSSVWLSLLDTDAKGYLTCQDIGAYQKTATVCDKVGWEHLDRLM